MPNGLQHRFASAFLRSQAPGGNPRSWWLAFQKYSQPVHTFLLSSRHRRRTFLSLVAGVAGPSYPKAGPAQGPALIFLSSEIWKLGMPLLATCETCAWSLDGA